MLERRHRAQSSHRKIECKHTSLEHYPRCCSACCCSVSVGANCLPNIKLPHATSLTQQGRASSRKRSLRIQQLLPGVWKFRQPRAVCRILRNFPLAYRASHAHCHIIYARLNTRERHTHTHLCTRCARIKYSCIVCMAHVSIWEFQIQAKFIKVHLHNKTRTNV